MKKAFFYIGIFIFILLGRTTHSQQKDFPVLTGPYLGQKPPGMKPEIFAPGIISTEQSEGSSGFALNGRVFIFQRFINHECHTYMMTQTDNLWSIPELIPFWKQLIHNGDFVISPDDKTMFYQVKKPVSGQLDSDIWQVELTGEGWGPKSVLPAPVNTAYDESFASRASSGNLYFFSSRPGGGGAVRSVHGQKRTERILGPGQSQNIKYPVQRVGSQYCTRRKFSYLLFHQTGRNG